MKSYSKGHCDVKRNVYSDEPTGRLALVFELMEMNLYDAIKGKEEIDQFNRKKTLPARKQS